jgi:hypothetical protein
MTCYGRIALYWLVLHWAFGSLTNRTRNNSKVKVKQSHYRPWQALRHPGIWGSQILRRSPHEGGKVVIPTHRPHLPLVNIPGTHLSQPQGYSAAGRLCQRKIPMTPSGIDPTTFRFVAQCLNHCSTTCKGYKVLVKITTPDSEYGFVLFLFKSRGCYVFICTIGL